MRQARIEKYIGITDNNIGNYIAKRSTINSQTAYNLLCMQVRCTDPCGLEMLKIAVEQCKEEIIESNKNTEKRV